MTKYKLCSVVAAAAMVLTSIVPVQAAPLAMMSRGMNVPVKASSPLVEEVQYHGRGWRAGPPRGYHRPPPRRFHGHRGYGGYRHGYRRSNGAWVPLAAFAMGAIISGAMSSQAAPRYGGSHHSWCANRYRSYRARDNSFQPYNGPRQRCVSPYMR